MRRAVEIAGGLRIRWNQLASAKRRSLSGGLLLLIVCSLVLAWYASRPDWRLLFSGLDGRDFAQVSQELGVAGIPFQATADASGVSVPAEMLDKARMAVAAKGMPQSGRLGFELFDKPNWVGSEFDERVNYQRALEGELEHTIGSLGAVQSARVHLVLPQPSLFASEEKLAKASVLLKLRRSRLPEEEVDSIRNLVAGAVENLSPEQVTLVDADGRADLTAKDRHGARDDEQAIETRLIGMLEPLAGTGNVRATVSVTYDQGREERTDEVYDPAQSALLTSQRSEQTSGAQKSALGVPGTASNTPPAAPAGTSQAGAQTAAPGTPPLLQQGATLPVFPQAGSGSGPSVKEESGTYAVTRHLLHTEQGPGRIQRVSTAIVVNDRQALEGSGKTEHMVWKPRSPEEMHRLQELAQAAVGFNPERGDSVVMQNISFSSNLPETKVAGTERLLQQAQALLAQPAVVRNLTFGLVGMAFLWFVFKPMASQAVLTLREQSQLSPGANASLVEPKGLASVSADPAKEASSDAAGKETQTLTAATGSDRTILEEVTRQIRRQPVQSTRLLETWITADSEAE